MHKTAWAAECFGRDPQKVSTFLNTPKPMLAQWMGGQGCKFWMVLFLSDRFTFSTEKWWHGHFKPSGMFFHACPILEMTVLFFLKTSVFVADCLIRLDERPHMIYVFRPHFFTCPHCHFIEVIYFMDGKYWETALYPLTEETIFDHFIHFSRFTCRNDFL